MLAYFGLILLDSQYLVKVAPGLQFFGASMQLYQIVGEGGAGVVFVVALPAELSLREGLIVGGCEAMMSDFVVGKISVGGWGAAEVKPAVAPVGGGEKRLSHHGY